MYFTMMLFFIVLFLVTESGAYSLKECEGNMGNFPSYPMLLGSAPKMPSDYQCGKSSDCQCKKTYNGFFYHCDMLLFARMVYSALKVRCNHTVGREDLAEKIHLISNLAKSSFGDLMMYDCPSDSISDFLYPDSIRRLTLHCEERKNLNLLMASFRNLNRLESIKISCGSLIRLPNDIFHTLSPTLKELAIENTMINRLGTGLLSNLSKLQYLKFENNTILKFSKTDFVGLHKLDLLILNKYSSAKLEDDLFDPIVNVSALQIFESRIKKLPRSFQRLQKLKSLKILRTSLELMDEDDCKSLKKIISMWIIENPFLDMHPNCMKYLNDAAMDIVLRGNRIANLLIHTLKMNSLQNFRISDNRRDIQTVEYLIFSETLIALEIRNSSIHSIREDFLGYVPNVEEIDLSDNNLRYLSESFFQYSEQLRRVNLSGNSLTSIPVSLFNNKPFLTSVHFSHNRISEIEFNLTKNLSSLNDLDLSFNKIQRLPRNPFSNIPSIENLDISNNNISSIDSVAMQEMGKLIEIRVGGNKLKDLFSVFPNKFTSLKILSAESNSFNNISWLNMPSLLRLNLANNLIEYLDYAVFDLCRDMRELNLSRNRIETLPRVILENQFEKLISLDLSYNRLKTVTLGGNYYQFPSYFRELQLEFLDLSGNDMEKFDLEMISSKKRIRKVSVRSSNITVLYCSFCYNPDILVLDFSYNNISSIFWTWYYDEELKTSGRISPFLHFELLEELYLEHNQITDIPIDFRILHPHLKILDLSFNKIKRLTHQDLLFVPNTFDPFGNANPQDICQTLTVDLRNNFIRSVDLPHSMLLRNVTRKCERHKYSHATILLGHNPFECGCKVIPFLRVVEEDVVLTSELWRSKGKDWLLQARINTNNLTCRYPEFVNGKLVAATETWLHHLLPTMGFCYLSEDKDHIDFG